MFHNPQVTFYEAFKNVTEYGRQRLFPDSNRCPNSSIEGLLLGGLAGGMYLSSVVSFYLIRYPYGEGWLGVGCYLVAYALQV